MLEPQCAYYLCDGVNTDSWFSTMGGGGIKGWQVGLVALRQFPSCLSVPVAGGIDQTALSFHSHNKQRTLVSVRRLLCPRFQRESIAATDRLAQAEATKGIGGELGQPLALALCCAVLHDCGIDKCVVNVAHDGDGRVDARKLFDGNDCRREVHAGSAEFLGDLDSHEAGLEQLLDDLGRHGLLLIHIPDLGLNHVRGQLADRVGHHRFNLGEVGERRRRNIGEFGGIAASGRARKGTTGTLSAPVTKELLLLAIEG